MLLPFPWAGHPDITPDRLIAVGSLIARGRNDALDRYEPEIGDDPWSLGCRAYRCSRYRIEEAIKIGAHAWLAILDASMQFTFKIGNVPVRFYRGSAEEPTERTLRISFPEIRQLSLALRSVGESRYEKSVFRFAVETHEDGEIDKIVFVEFVGEVVENFWEIPFMPSPCILYSVSEPKDEGVELPRPPVKRRDDEGDAGMGTIDASKK